MSNAGIGRTWQDIRLFPSLTIAEQLGIAFDKKCRMSRDLWSSVSRKEVESLLDELGIADLANSRGDSVSLGQSKRVAIARAVASGAELLFLDEPLAGLDAKGIESVIEMLSRLVRSKGISLVIVEHVFNHRFLDTLVNRELRLEKGKLSDRPITVTNTASSSEKTNASLGGFSPIATPNAEVLVERLPRGAVLTRIRNLNAYRPDAPAVFEINNLVVRRGNRSVIGIDDYGQEIGLSLTVRPGEIAILQAPNGWGKTTLFDALTKTIQVSKGLARTSQRLIAIPSDNYLFPGLTVGDWAKLSASPLTDRFKTMLNRKCGSLSGGEGKRLAMLALKTDGFWVMDEPFNGLDLADELLAGIVHHSAAGNGAFALIPIARTQFDC
jgi:ABC-type multidrug transport system ATPase subunit